MVDEQHHTAKAETYMLTWADGSTDAVAAEAWFLDEATGFVRFQYRGREVYFANSRHIRSIAAPEVQS